MTQKSRARCVLTQVGAFAAVEYKQLLNIYGRQRDALGNRMVAQMLDGLTRSPWRPPRLAQHGGTS
jgi:hypothetical protein